MPEIINNGKGLLRINKSKNVIEYSRIDGRTWVLWCNCGTMYGTFHDLLKYGNSSLHQQRTVFLSNGWALLGYAL